MASRKQNFNAGTSYLGGKGKTPSYLYTPHKDLPGVFDAIPANRKARREMRKDPRFADEIKNQILTYPHRVALPLVRAFPLMRVMNGYQRLNAQETKELRGESRRDWIRMMQGRISKELLKKKILRRTK